MTQENRDESVYVEGGGNYASATINDKSKAYILASIISINLLATVWMLVEWKMAERENRLLQYYVMELDGKMMASGLLNPPESWSGRNKEKLK